MMRGFCPRGFCPEGAYVLMELCMEGVLSEGFCPTFYIWDDIFICQRMASQAFTSVTFAILTCQLKWVVTNVKGGSWFYSALVAALASG